jgi:predicted naringenin-chalcone synthase
VELCSIHFQKNSEDDHLLSAALFGDGAAAMLMQGGAASGLKPVRFFSDLARQGHDDMAWHVGDHGFEMRLSSYVPELIEAGIGTLTERLLQRLGLRVEDIDFFAIHPGGKKILESIEKALKMSADHNAPAYHVLRQYGNMSSPTVLFVLREILEKLSADDRGKKVLSFAFGPGLTLESMLLEVV